jgi:GNAT superfamily N-acetyltransferase
MARSFSGSKMTGPEGVLSWVLDENASVDGDPCNPLIADPDPERKEVFEFVLKFCAAICLKHGCCFALFKGGKVVAATLMTPPSTRAIYKLGGCGEMILAMQLGMPKVFVSGESAVKHAAVDKAMAKAHKMHAHAPHWYIYAIAVDNEAQGKGYGRELMDWVSNCANATGHPAYLETMGPRNIRFYEKNGYEVKETAPLEYKWKGSVKKCEMHGGLTAMVRQPINNEDKKGAAR